MYVIPGEMADPLLQDLAVEAVHPAPDATRLLVVLTATRPAVEASEIFERLEQVRGHLRAEVAAAVNRKRAPELAFQLSLAREVAP
jgi:ribosome-binding factor A